MQYTASHKAKKNVFDQKVKEKRKRKADDRPTLKILNVTPSVKQRQDSEVGIT